MTINKAIVKEIYSDNLFTEIEEYLNSVIDEELEKDDVDTDLIDECIDAIDSLRVNDINPALKIVLTEQRVLKYCKKQTNQKSAAQKRAIAACLIVAMCSSAVLFNTNTAFANYVKDAFEQIISILNITADESEDGNLGRVSSIYAAFPPDYSFSVKSKGDIDLRSMTVVAVYQNGSEKNVPISKCTVKFTENFNDDKNQILVSVGYNGCAFSVIFTVEE